MVYKLAQYIVNSGNADLDVDLSCLTTANVTDMSVENIITLLINKVCTLQDLVNDLGSGDTVPDPLLTIAQCFRTTDAYGDVQTTMQHTAYTSAIGLKVCTINTTVNTHASTLTSYGNRLTVLEAAIANPATNTGTVSLTCSGTNSPLTFANAILNLENQICTLRNATGTATALTQAAANQCLNLSTSAALSKAGTMAAIPGWKTSVSTTADSLTNLWLTVCDLRDAFKNIRGLIKNDCSSIVVDFAVAQINGGAAVNVFFSGYSSIPSNWSNCTATQSKMTITDTAGGRHIVNVDVVSQANNAAPLVIQLEGTPLNLTTALTFTLEACLTDGTVICSKNAVRTLGNTVSTCPSLVVTPNVTALSYSFSPTVTNNVVYKVSLLTNADVEITSKTYTNPQSVVSDTFTGLTASTTYKLRTTVTVGTAAPVVCTPTSHTTADSSTGPCNPPTNISGTFSE